MRRLFGNLPSIQVGYLAAIFAEAGHDVRVTRDKIPDGDLALVLTSIVDYRREVAWAEAAKARYGMQVGFFGTFATHVSEVVAGHGDFVIKGEPEHAAMRLARGETLEGIVDSPAIMDLDSLPFPRWDLVAHRRFNHAVGRSMLPAQMAVPLMSSRSCPEHCTYCPHRITAAYRARSPQNVVDEIEALCRRHGRVYLIFRDPLFTEVRERSTTIAEEIIRRKLPVHFECETRLDDLDTELIDLLHRAGLRAINFGVEAAQPVTLKKVARRPIPPAHQKAMVAYCRKKGVATTGFYVFGFLTDTLDTINATIDYSLDLDTDMALFKILTPYPGTPLRKQMNSLVTETDLQKFDGYTPTFRHPTLTAEQLLYALRTAYARFYVRPSWPLKYLGLKKYSADWLARADARAREWQLEHEAAYYRTLEVDHGEV
jgi:radical SAM superfamily enzyme YgiQ (UPF0313 family)